MPASFEDYVHDVLAPPWLRGPYGAGLARTLGRALDQLVATSKLAVKARFPAHAPADALDRLGADRLLERYPVETDAAYRARIADAWGLWEWGGTAYGVDQALTAAGLPGAFVYTWHDFAPWVPTPYETWWSAFWVDVAGHPYAPDGTWADAGTWDDTVPGHNGAPAGPGTWDSDATAVEVAVARAAIRKWKSGHEILAAIRFLVGDDRWDDGLPWDDGAWDDTAALFEWAG